MLPFLVACLAYVIIRAIRRWYFGMIFSVFVRLSSERNHAPSGWPRLKEFVKILDKGGFHDGPIRETIKHFAEAITDQDILKAVEAKKSQLEKCFQDLSIRYSGTKPPILTSAVQNLCRVIKGELDDMFEMKKRNEVSTASSTSCHAIQTYFERLALNIDVETWKIDDGELAVGVVFNWKNSK
ncbi:hypothetical protein FRC11_007745 [Ceratobasidium sp. 423]|nr:hypothetical protein FRC11_007745 [Ceratobasidium sp. 423]